MVVAGFNLINLQIIYQIFSFICLSSHNRLFRGKNPQIIKFEFVLGLLSTLGLNEEWSCKVFNKQMLGSFLFQKNKIIY